MNNTYNECCFIKAIYSSLLILLLVSIANVATGQSSVTLSTKHLARINKKVEPWEKLSLYRKYFSKDSVKWVKAQAKSWRHKFDSLNDAISDSQTSLKKIEKSLEKGAGLKVTERIYRPWATHQANLTLSFIKHHNLQVSPKARQMIYNYFYHYFLQSSSKPQVLHELHSKFPQMQFPKTLTNQISQFQALSSSGIRPELVRKFESIVLPDVTSWSKKIESVKHPSSRLTEIQESFKARVEQEAMAHAPLKGVGDQLAERRKLERMKEDYEQKVVALGDSANIRNQAREKAEELAMKYLSENPALLQGVQRKMSILMKKYSVVPNSNDLSTAVKRTSLKGRTLLERLQIGGNFQVISLQPISIDFSPQLGYKFNSRFVVGAGGLYRKTFSDSLKSIAADVIGYKAFTNYQFGSLFLSGEFGRNSPAPKVEESAKRLWENSMVIGIGRSFHITPKIEMLLMGGYNLLYDHKDTVYPRPWVIRVGFRSSELAFLNKNRVVPNLPN